MCKGLGTGKREGSKGGGMWGVEHDFHTMPDQRLGGVPLGRPLTVLPDCPKRFKKVECPWRSPWVPLWPPLGAVQGGGWCTPATEGGVWVVQGWVSRLGTPFVVE